jgi:hypothetical protein
LPTRRRRKEEQDKLIKEKTGKGYAEVAVAGGTALAKVNSPALCRIPRCLKPCAM